MTQCPLCTAPVDPNDAICGSCGQDLQADVCHNGHPLPPGIPADQCPWCPKGAKAPSGGAPASGPRVAGTVDMGLSPVSMPAPSLPTSPPPAAGGRTARRKTIVVDDGPPPAASPAAPVAPVAPAAPAATPPARKRNKTVVFDDVDQQGGEEVRRARGDRGKLVAVLVSFSAKPAGELWPLRQGRTTIGTDAECDVQLEYDGVSRTHATIVSRSGVIWVVDNESTNGTFVNGNDIVDERVRLSQADTLKVGPIQMSLLVVPDAQP